MNLFNKILILGSVSVSGHLFSQSAVCDSTNWAKAGTYEVITIPGTTEGPQTSKLNLSAEMLCLIESKREEDKTIEYIYDTYTMIRIFPKKGLITETPKQ